MNIIFKYYKNLKYVKNKKINVIFFFKFVENKSLKHQLFILLFESFHKILNIITKNGIY